MPKTYEYHEGSKANENFESGLKALFQVPKDAVLAKKKPAKSGLRKPANAMVPAILAARLKASEPSGIRVGHNNQEKENSQKKRLRIPHMIPQHAGVRLRLIRRVKPLSKT